MVACVILTVLKDDFDVNWSRRYLSRLPLWFSLCNTRVEHRISGFLWDNSVRYIPIRKVT